MSKTIPQAEIDSYARMKITSIIGDVFLAFRIDLSHQTIQKVYPAGAYSGELRYPGFSRLPCF